MKYAIILPNDRRSWSWLFLGQVIQLLHKFVAREDGLLKVVAELYRAMRTRQHAQLAERAASQVIHIFVQFPFFLPVGHFHHLGVYVDCAVGTIHLT